MKELETKKYTDLLTLKGLVRITQYFAGTKKIKWQSAWMENRIMIGADTGKDLILDRLASNNTYSLNITHGDIGTDNTIPVDGDIALGAAVVRAEVTTKEVSSNNVQFLFFFSDSVLTNNTYKEFGMFIDGSSALGSGQIFNRVLFSIPYVKGSGEDSTIEVNIKIT